MEYLINYIRDKLKKDYNIDSHWVASPYWEKNDYDGKLELTYRQISETFQVNHKKHIKRYHIAQLFQQLPDPGKTRLIIGETIDRKAKKAIIAHGANYIDGAVNMYIAADNMLIKIEGNKYELGEQQQGAKLFNRSTFKVIFALLVKEDLINQTYRDIAEYSGSSLGSVNNVINQLKVSNYVIELDNETLKIQNKKNLLERWIDSYEEKFKIDLFIDRCDIRNEDWKSLKFEYGMTMWGGEPAAEILTQYLIARDLIFYTEENTSELIIKYRIVPNINGKTEIYKKFWNFDLKEFINTVPPLLIYADLIGTDEPRNLETAKIIYERYLQDKFE